MTKAGSMSMRGLSPRDGRTFTTNSWLEPNWAAGAAFTRFELSSAGSGPRADALLLVTPDEAGDGIGLAPGNPVLVVDAPAHTLGALGTLGDQDYYQVTL